MPINWNATPTLIGAIVNRPTAPSLPAGVIYIASDTGRWYRTDEVTWTDITSLSSGAGATAGTQYVSTTGSDANTGNSWVSAKLTISAAITALAGAGGVVNVGVGTFAMSASVTVPANVTIRGFNRYITTISVTSLIAGGVHRAPLELLNGSNGVIIEDVGFNVTTANTAITIMAGNNIEIRRCYFTGAQTGLGAIAIATYDSAGIDGVTLQDNNFVGVTATYGVVIQTTTARTIKNVTVFKNRFERCKYAGVKFTATSGVVTDTVISYNRFIDIIGDAPGTGQYGTAVTGGLDTAYQLDGVFVTNNIMRQTRANERCGGVFIYSATRVKVNDNDAVCTTNGVDTRFTDGVTIIGSPTFTSATAVFTAADTGLPLVSPNVPAGTTMTYVNANTVTMSQNATASSVAQKFYILNRGGVTDSTFLAPGRVGVPDIGVEIMRNQVKGYGSFWDPDSTSNAEVASNKVYNCSPGGMSMFGYGTWDNVDVHDNLVIDSIPYLTPAAIAIGNIVSAKAGKIHDNTIIDTRDPAVMLYGLETTGGGVFDSSDVDVNNNKIYLTNSNLVAWQFKQNAANVPPLVQIHNQVTQPSGRTYEQKVATGAIAVTASPFTWTNTLPYPVLVNIFGGTVSNVSSTDLQIANSSPATALVQPGRAVIVTYTVLPTMRYEKAV